MDLKLRVWRQAGPGVAGGFETYEARDVSPEASFFEMLDQVNELGFKDSALAFRLNFQAANWCAGPLSDDEGKVKYATKAKAIGSDSKEQLLLLDEWIG